MNYELEELMDAILRERARMGNARMMMEIGKNHPTANECYIKMKEEKIGELEGKYRELKRVME